MMVWSESKVGIDGEQSPRKEPSPAAEPNESSPRTDGPSTLLSRASRRMPGWRVWRLSGPAELELHAGGHWLLVIAISMSRPIVIRLSRADARHLLLGAR